MPVLGLSIFECFCVDLLAPLEWQEGAAWRDGLCCGTDCTTVCGRKHRADRFKTKGNLKKEKKGKFN